MRGKYIILIKFWGFSRLGNKFDRKENMARNVVENENDRSLTLMGDGRSLGLTIPIRLVRKLDLKPRQKVRVTLRGENIVIKTNK